MSDKSFGDHINRNIVKNPLLSSAVTGLCLEDLTHNAVLLPAPSQQQVTRLDQQGSQLLTLANADHDRQSFPSGDAFSNIPLSHPPSNTRANLDNQISDKNRNPTFAPPISTQSKASSKSEDDFDVNEYIARLQGTRYVSAPLHSHLKEDQNVSLEPEESLEEINLNDNERIEPEVQQNQSLTADIAQNFSQLPAVLPHVASAVFSSFSNMLNMRSSREQTPDAPYQDTRYDRTELEVPPMPVEESAPRDYGLPPKEPPATGISGYRITSKKKYAQIPGLSYGGAPNIPNANAPSMSYPANMPALFNPESFANNEVHSAVDDANDVAIAKVKRQNVPFEKEPKVIDYRAQNIQADADDNDGVMHNRDHNIQNATRFNTEALVSNVDWNIDVPVTGVLSHNVENVPHNIASAIPQVPPTNVSVPTQKIADEFKDITTPRLPIIPPPPMFSNQRKESQTAKSVLAPSVARRISGNQPLIKQPIPTPSFTDNIFVPSDPGTALQSAQNMEPNIQSSDATFTQLSQPQFYSPATVDSSQLYGPSTGSQVSVASNMPPPNLFPSSSVGVQLGSNAFSTPSSTIFTPALDTASQFFTPVLQEISVPPPNLFSSTPVKTISNVRSNAFPSVSNVPTTKSYPTHPSTIISSGLSNAPSVSMFTPPTFFDPAQKASTQISEARPLINPSSTAGLTVAPPNNPSMFTPQPSTYFIPQPQEALPPASEPKPLIEPPKATGLNFRMAKKRPQYYSGPIEGVGDLSNNIKPVLNPVVPLAPSVETNYQGSLLTPEQKLQTEATSELTAQSAEVPFDINRQNYTETAPFDLGKQNYTQNADYSTQNVGITTFDSNPKPLDHAQQSARYHPQPNYGQYNTAFDLSRTTDEYEQPKQESKGFGIIGSLKSKLSSIDINKIQSSVTTFFDPTFNEGKSEPIVETASFAPQIYSQYPQTNFEVTVPSIDSQYGYPGYTYDQNQYNPAQNAYSHAQNEGDNAFYTEPFAQQLYGSTGSNYSSNYNQQNIPLHENKIAHKVKEHLYRAQDEVSKDTSGVIFFNKGVIQPTKLETKPSEECSASIDKSYVNPNIGTHGAIGDIAKPTIGEESYKQVIGNKASSFFDNPSDTSESLLQIRDSEDLIKKNIKIQSNTRFIPPLPPAMSFFDSPTINDNDKKPEDLTEEMQKLALAEAIAIAPSPITDIELSKGGESKVLDHKITTSDVQIFSLNKDDIDINQQGKSIIESLAKDDTLSNVPLFGRSAVLPDKTQEKSKASLSISDVKNVLLFDPPQENIGAVLKRNASSSVLKDLPEAKAKEDENLSQDRGSTWNFDKAMVTSKENVNLLFDKKTSGFFDHMSLETVPNDPNSEHAVNFNICETCREVNTPVEKETDDITKHMIENVTSSIQLSNPVEALLAERNSFTIEEREFQAETVNDINRVTEETIETLQGQYASEQQALLEDATHNNPYSWTLEQLDLANKNSFDLEFAYSNADHSDCDLDVDKYNYLPEYMMHFDDSIVCNDNQVTGNFSFFSDKHCPKNASDEIKAELKTHEDVLPRQMSIPTAPPEAEEDTKSDATGGLDVLSIEQDANKDFPLEEEFIIEPSETDDDKIEFRERKRSSEDSVNDTFADRIERFKNKSAVDYGTSDVCQTSQPKSMSSYFDIRNNASETHNSFDTITSTEVNRYMSTVEDPNVCGDGMEVPEEAFRLPPGFEDELRRQFYELNSPNINEPFIPDTTTQTKTTTSITSTSGSTYITGACGTETTYSSQNVNNNNLTGLEANIITVAQPLDSKQSNQSTDRRENKNEKRMETLTLTKAFSFDEINHETDSSTSKAIDAAMKASEQENTAKAPSTDPMNFFTNIEESNPAEQESFNRLASYFSMPTAEPDHSKSFFELSQSQNHYRHSTNTQKDKNPKVLDDQTRANIQSLMHDLTSTENIKFSDDTVQIVTYFTVEFDNEPVLPKQENNNNINSCQTTDKQAARVNLDKSLQNFEENNAQANQNIDLSDSQNINNNYEKESNTNKVDDKATMNKDIITKINSREYCCNIKLNKTNDYIVKMGADTDKEGENTKKERQSMSEIDSYSQSQSVSVDFGSFSLDEAAQDGTQVLNEGRSSSEYVPVRHHWFYRVDVDDKSLWRGFSTVDSDALEQAYRSQELNEDALIPTDGGRFDVNIIGRLRVAVYWKEKPTNVRRCSWFYKGTTDARYVPYTEAVADKLEEEFRHGVTTGEWHRRLVLPNNELVVMHGPAVMVHFVHAGAADSFSPSPFLLGKKVYRNPPRIRVARDHRQTVDHLILVVHGAGEYKKSYDDAADSSSRPRVVRRGHEESEIEDPEPSSIDHLLLLCHGVGSACDMRFRSVEEVVEDFRSTSLQLVQSHYRSSFDNGVVNRVEVLPISWHSQLHVGERGVDKRLSKVTLESIPRLRAFTNHTVLDALFYTSPVYHQTIIDTVCSELNRVYHLFQQRNPSFKGGVSLGGHSLGSVILYDLLCHQTPEKPVTPMSRADKTYLPSARPALESYPQLTFPPHALYALGSPIAIFECIRGVEALGMDFALPTCKHFFNIFHPYDPIAYRIEPLINPLLQDAKPFLIPHHKGRKRMHLELKDTMVRVGSDLKQKLLESLRTTWNKWKASPPPDGQLEKVVEEEMEKEHLCDEAREDHTDPELTTPAMLGKLNCGRRVDYVLQEAPLEMINEYLFAMSSHVGYWESEDTMLLMLREIYAALGVQPDCTVPQQSMTVTRTRQDETIVVNDKEYPSTSRELS